MELQEEQEELASINRVFTEVTDSLESFQKQLKRFYANVDQTSQLLDLWADIMVQTTLNYNIMSEPGWQGGTQDKVNLERAIEKEKAEIEAREEEERQRLIAEENERKRIEQLLISQEIARKAKEVSKPPTHPSLHLRGRATATATHTATHTVPPRNLNSKPPTRSSVRQPSVRQPSTLGSAAGSSAISLHKRRSTSSARTTSRTRPS